MSEKTFRPSAIELLKLLSSLSAQRQFQKNVPMVDVSAELRCMWLDDFYHPTTKFKESFSEDELRALQEFDEFLERRLEKLPESLDGLDALHKSHEWLEIVHQARETLRVFLACFAPADSY